MEHINSAVVAAFGMGWLFLAYKIYGRIIERRVIQPDDERSTPAFTKKDGVDFYPARPLVLFGHHFSSIAGAGPIVGPVIAAGAFGFGVSALWILIGVVLIGAVHDYTTLMLSVRKDGQSIPEITGAVVGPTARLFFQLFVLVTLIFVVAVFGIAAAKSFISDPRIVIPAFGLIPLAMGFVFMVNRMQWSVMLATILTLAGLVGLFFLGLRYPLALPISGSAAMQAWLAILLLYGAVAAVLPVWILLQPRDYVASWLLAFGMLAGFVGIFVTAKPVVAPMMTAVVSEKQGPVWPMLFILIACGAVSGFHALVSSGTTAKQLRRESDGKAVAFGGMITEGGLALLALLAVTAGMAFTSTSPNVPSLQGFLADGGGGPITAFATGFGVFTEPFLGVIGVLLGMTMLNAFVLTTLDTSVRLARFVTVELVGDKVPLLKNRYLATLVVVLPAYALAAGGKEGALWPMFGAANQLVAALSMIVVSAYLAQEKKPTLYTAIPAAFMLLTTVAALMWQGYSFLTAKVPNYGLFVAALLLFCLAIYVGVRGLSSMKRA